MARKPMVTRTIKATEVTVMALDISVGEPQNITVTISGNVTDKAKMLKAVKSVAETDTLKVVHVVDHTTTEKMYGMLETDFIAHATELDPETRKMIETETECEE